MTVLLLIGLYLATLSLFCGIAGRLPLLSPQAQNRVSSLDGLRGILATAVLAHHFCVSFYWHVTGVWQMTESRTINNMGAVPVSLFFMITGYLFGRKIYKTTPQWGAVLSSRVRRVFPMYLFTVAIIFAISFYQNSAVAAGPPAETLSTLGHWLVFVGTPIQGIESTIRINASVQWTLLYEAMFYLSLPLLYCALRRRRPGVAALVAVVLLGCLWPIYADHFNTRFIKLFVIGITIAIAEDRLRRARIDYCAIRCTVLAIAVLMLCMALQPYGKAQMILLAIPFALFVLGNNLMGILEHRGIKVLGEASFSIYLLHGIVIYLLFNVLAIHDFANASFTQYLWYLPLVILLVSSLSVLTYFAIERPMMVSRKKHQADSTIQ